jgi:hypothetical protein
LGGEVQDPGSVGSVAALDRSRHGFRGRRRPDGVPGLLSANRVVVREG